MNVRTWTGLSSVHLEVSRRELSKIQNGELNSTIRRFRDVSCFLFCLSFRISRGIVIILSYRYLWYYNESKVEKLKCDEARKVFIT